MFSENISFICRRCAKPFELDDTERKEALKAGRFECSHCSYETVPPGLQAFLRFYPRLVKSEKLLASEGVVWKSYTIGNLMNLGIYNWLKEKMTFSCKSCKNEWNIKFDPDTLEYKQRPKSFFCPQCLHSPSAKTTKEFFMSINQLLEATFKLNHAQWNIFTPIGQEIPLKQIQSKIFVEKYKI